MNKRSGAPDRRRDAGDTDRESNNRPRPYSTNVYNFVPVIPKLAVTDTPVTHEVLHANQDEYFTGTLFWELTALTPLAAMSRQSSLIDREDKHAFEQHFVAPLRKRGLTGEVDTNKKLLEPLRLMQPGQDSFSPVLIAGATLKGCLRNQLQSLLTAPMERVQEQRFSFRPNLEREVCVPVIVNEVRWTKDRKQITRLVLEGRTDPKASTHAGNGLVYVHPDAEAGVLAFFARKYGIQGDPETGLSWGKRQQAVTDPEFNDAELRNGNTLKRSPGRPQTLPGDWQLLRYRGGSDGQGTLLEAFNQANSGEGNKQVYRWALRGRNPDDRPLTLSDTQLNAISQLYWETRELLADEKRGHLRNHPLRSVLKKLPGGIAGLVEQIKSDQFPQPGDLLYLEKVNGTAIGVGHHFRHRRAFRDSIHQSYDSELAEGANLKTNQAFRATLRNVLRPLALEVQRQGDRPAQLSAARLLFGYCAPSTTMYSSAKPNEPFCHGIGERDFQQLAGRVSFNFAIEQPRSDGDRFINEGQGALVPLRPLGEPKPGAYEMYLTQDRLGKAGPNDFRLFCTYGDMMTDLQAGDLRGRKAYYHQPEAAHRQDRYRFEPRSLGAQQAKADADECALFLGQHSAVAKDVLAPGVRLRCAMRGVNLRWWELGAILLAFEIRREDVRRLLELLQLAQHPKLKQTLESATKATDQSPAYGIKLGHGRPLGLGSVRAACVAVDRLQPAREHLDSQVADPDAIRQQAIQALADKLKSALGAQLEEWALKVLLPWLRLHQFHGTSENRSYPSLRDSVIAWHNENRKQHAKSRHPAGAGKPSPAGLGEA